MQVAGSSAHSLGWPDTTAEPEAVQFHYGVIPKLQAGHKLVGAQQNNWLNNFVSGLKLDTDLD